ncbi:NAD(P)H-dependent glycerol-3-phosphate dehydrogenase [Zongyangia hominis]|uniref:Glycerol-3-phosphate dehydrogenase [NAD(P)+] n=1 Tax=Zongyangia hominis TaxID=2763677 RepID=A0A926I661_9FIRM|nr:NAD(P)H-dependent glycerol-3-phosphate dehydrogenase [Zongyangia hominis]MBC8569684.1 NAD(P)-dependent glycerol-3-phosphate dehydrogenase [Zongyangia hominis]
MKNIAVLGCGFGTALSIMCRQMGYDVTLWSPFAEEIAAIRREGEHRKLLPGIKLPEGIRLTCDLSCTAHADMILLAVPSHAVRATAQKLASIISPRCLLVNVAKGLEEESLLRLSQVIAEELPQNPLVVLSGPSHAEEVGRGQPTTVVAASADHNAAEAVQDLLMNQSLRIYVNDDLTGVELGGALKNIIALAAGVLDGLGYGDNAKAALLTRGITEISRLGCALGARQDTFAGLTGIGDLIVTCTSPHSRNRRAGILIGQGKTAAEAVAAVGTVEGYRSARCAYALARRTGVEMPIIEQVYQVLFEGKAAGEAVECLMARPKKHEMERSWLTR